MDVRYSVIGDWLVADTGECTCGSGDRGDHNEVCGVESIALISDILEWARTN